MDKDGIAFMYEEDWAADEREYQESRETERMLNLQSRQIAYEADVRNGFPLGPQPAPQGYR